MAEIDDMDVTDANNTTRWPEGMLGGQINDSARALEGILARWYQDTNGSLESSGSSNAFAVTSNRTINALTDGIRLSFKANHTIDGAATLDLNSIGAKDIKRFNGNALASGDIVSGQIIDVVYSADLEDWLMVSALAASTGNMFADFDENATPGDPAANDARLYAKDDGNGTTVLAYRDATPTESIIGGIATQAEMEAATSVIKTTSPGRQHFHPGHPKAGGNLNGTGTPAFRSGDYGMGAVTDLGTGNYRLSFDTAFANTNYWCAGFARAGSGSTQPVIVSGETAGTKTTSAVQITTERRSDGVIDSADVGVTFWGDYA